MRKSVIVSNEAKMLTVDNTGAMAKFDALRWQQEIKRLIEQTTTEADKKALNCFGDAIKPFLEDPKRLRTLLGKIAI